MHVLAAAHGERNLPRCGEVPRDLSLSNRCGCELARYSACRMEPKAGLGPFDVL